MIQSKFKFFCPLLVIFLTLLLLCLSGFVLYAIVRSGGEVPAAVLIFEILFVCGLILISAELKSVTIRDERIIFTYPLRFFYRKTRPLSCYGACYIVAEYARDGTHDALWLMGKDGKLKDRISSAYYRNFEEMQAVLTNWPKSGRRHFSPFEQLAYMMGKRMREMS